MATFRYATLLLCLLLTTTCKDTSPSTTAGPKATTAPATAPAGETPYPSIDMNRIAYLYINATYMDATFYNLPISINQNELPQIQSTLAGIDSEPPVIAAGCQPAGHIWFQINGKNKEEADIYFQEDCKFYVWYEDGKPAYANKMNANGINFYQNIINSVQQQLNN